jgi:hypothetical protein
LDDLQVDSFATVGEAISPGLVPITIVGTNMLCSEYDSCRPSNNSCITICAAEPVTY